MNEVTIEHINHLSDIQLTKLLHTLIKLEAEKNKLQDWDRNVPFNITTADAGSDGRIIWNGNPPETRWLKNKFTIFQNKATELGPKACFEEILENKKRNKPRKLKAQIEKLVTSNGCYILFTNKPIVDNGIDLRIAKFREAIQLAGHKNYAKFQILIYDSNSIKDWVNEYIGAISLVQKFNGIERLLGAKIYDEWKDKKDFINNVYQKDEKIIENIKLIKEIIGKEKVIRINGHSGLGKTRIVLEAFRNNALNNNVLYYDLEGSEDISLIKNFLNSYQETQTGILIIDNCDFKRHNTLSETVKEYDGGIKLISMGLDDSNSVEDPKIKIDRDDQRNIVKEIVQRKIGITHQISDIEYISTISEGYPWMAIRFCDIVLKQGMIELNKIPIDEFIKKLIFGSDKIEYDVIRACSVFSAFGFLDDSFRDIISDELKKSLKAQMDFIRIKIYDGNITDTRFREICGKFLNEDIIERRGTFYIVKPTILAINLAADWLIHTDSDRIIEIIQKLKEVKLEEKFADRLKDLDQIDKAKDIVKELWGPNRPFSTAEVLNTSWGSLLFRYVVEVNPIATAKALEATFGKMTKKELFAIKEGRRNLVWALEKLCFRKQTFNIAAKIFYSFAVSENETWSNNSTHQFCQLFQLFLSGTEAKLGERLEIINWGMIKNDDDYTGIAIHAMTRSLITDHYTRMGGPEKQGRSVPLQDNVPTQKEVSEYWQEIISILTDLACSKSQYSSLAQATIADSIRNLLRVGEADIILDSIQKIIKVKGGLWLKALNNLNMTLSFEKHLPKEIVNRINAVIIQLTPQDIKNQLLLKITKAEWESYEKDDEDFYIDKSKIKAEEFAEKLIKDKIDWIRYIEDLLHDEQRQAFNFGFKVGELTIQKEKLIESAIKGLRNIKKENQNPELLAGILVGTKNKNLVEKTINDLISDNDLRHHVFYLTRITDPSYKEIEKLFVLIDKYGFSINQFQIFQYGRALDMLSVEEVLLLCSRIEKYDNSGKWVALSLLYMFNRNSEDRRKATINFLKDLLANTNMITDRDSTINLSSYYWSDTVIQILKQPQDKKFAITISKQIIEFCSQTNFNYSIETYVSNVVIDLFDNYFDGIWGYFGRGLLENYITFSHIKSFIGKGSIFLDDSVGLAFRTDHRCDVILDWCKKYSPKASERIANMMPLGILSNGKTIWHKFSRTMINEFGNNEKFLDQLSANMGTFGTVGSRVPYFQKQKDLFLELISHKLDKVRNWAAKGLEYTEKTIKRESLSDEEDFL